MIEIRDDKLYRTFPIDKDVDKTELVITREEFQKALLEWGSEIGRWVSVNEKLPKHPGTYIVFGKDLEWIKTWECEFFLGEWRTNFHEPQIIAWLSVPNLY